MLRRFVVVIEDVMVSSTKKLAEPGLSTFCVLSIDRKRSSERGIETEEGKSRREKVKVVYTNHILFFSSHNTGGLIKRHKTVTTGKIMLIRIN